MMHPLTDYRNLHSLSMEAFAAAIGASKGMVSKWERWIARPNERYMQLIFEATQGSITPNDFYRISSPDDSSSGEAGASSPPKSPDAPANSCQGRAEVARLAHNQEVAGLNPAPATSFSSSGNLPPDDAGARVSGISRAPATVSGEVGR